MARKADFTVRFGSQFTDLQADTIKAGIREELRSLQQKYLKKISRLNFWFFWSKKIRKSKREKLLSKWDEEANDTIRQKAAELSSRKEAAVKIDVDGDLKKPDQVKLNI